MSSVGKVRKVCLTLSMSNPSLAAPLLTSITGAVVADDRTRLELESGRVVDVPVLANQRAAATLRGRVRRITAVEIDSEHCSAVAIGTGHRLPFVRVIPVSMALGLLALGVPGVAR